MTRLRPFSPLLLSLSLLLLAVSPALADVELAPGETASDVAADDSASTCDPNDCEVSFDLPNSTMLLTATSADGADVMASASLLANFSVSAESDDPSDQTPLLGSSLSINVNATGSLDLDGMDSTAGYRLDVLVSDTGSGAAVGAAKIAEGVATGASEMVDVSEMEVLNLNLTRGHDYQVSLTLSVFALAGAGGTAVANFGGSSASWDGLTLVAGADVLGEIGDLNDRVDALDGRVDALQEQVDELDDAFRNHTHEYLTGRGVGHNNTTAVTSGPEGSDGPVVDPDAVDPAPAPGNSGSHRPPRSLHRR